MSKFTFVTILTPTKTITLPDNIIQKSLLLTNLADDDLLKSDIIYKYDLTTEEASILEEYFMSGSIPKLKYKVAHILQFINYFSIDEALSLIKHGEILPGDYEEIFKLQQRW